MLSTIDGPLERGTSDDVVGDNLTQGQISEITPATDIVSSQVADSVNTGAVPGTSTNAKGGAETTDSEVSSDDDDDPDIAAMKEELMRYRSRAPGNRPSAGAGKPSSTSQRPGPPPNPSKKNRPPAVTSSSKTTAHSKGK